MLCVYKLKVEEISLKADVGEKEAAVSLIRKPADEIRNEGLNLLCVDNHYDTV